MAEKTSGTGVLDVTLGMRVNLNVYGPDGKPVAYNKCELWAEVKAADAASAREELDRQVEEMMGDYALTFGPNAAESPLIQKSPIQRATEEYEKLKWTDSQLAFASAFKAQHPGVKQVTDDSWQYEKWRAVAESYVGKEKFDAFRKSYADSLKKS